MSGSPYHDAELADTLEAERLRKLPPELRAEIQGGDSQYERIRAACQHAADGIDLDATAARISLTVRQLRRQNSLPGVRLARRTARTPESGNGDRTPPAGSDTLSLSTNGTETPVRIRASRVPGTPSVSPGRSVGREREVTSNGDRRKTPSRESAAVARKEV